MIMEKVIFKHTIQPRPDHTPKSPILQISSLLPWLMWVS